MGKRTARSSRPQQTGSRVVSDLRDRLRAGWPAGLTVLTGDDLYHLDEAQKLLLEALVPAESSEFALTVLGEDRVDVGIAVGAARTVGMFSSRRVVLVRYVESLDGEPDALSDFAKSPPPDGYLIVRAPSLDQRRKLHKALVRDGNVLAFSSGGGDPGRLAGEVLSIAKGLGLRLDRDGAIFLAEAAGADLYRAASELRKIDALLGDEKNRQVSLDLLRDTVATGGLMSGWEVAGAILERDRAAALAAARRLVSGGDEPIRIVGGLAWRARVMIQAKALLDRGMPPKQVLQATRAWGFGDALLRGLARYTMEELLAFPLHLLEADRTLKSRSIAPFAVLEALVDRLTRSRATPGRSSAATASRPRPAGRQGNPRP